MVRGLLQKTKPSGLDVESTRLQDIRRVEKLLCLVMTAFVRCYKMKDYLTGL